MPENSSESSKPYPRDMVGYGESPPVVSWPGNARLAVQFVINYEEGGENSVLHGDEGSEAFLSEISGARPHPARYLSMESLYEYGSRAGFWRLHRLFNEFSFPVTPCTGPRYHLTLSTLQTSRSFHHWPALSVDRPDPGKPRGLTSTA